MSRGKVRWFKAAVQELGIGREELEEGGMTRTFGCICMRRGVLRSGRRQGLCQAWKLNLETLDVQDLSLIIFYTLR